MIYKTLLQVDAQKKRKVRQTHRKLFATFIGNNLSIADIALTN